MMKILSDSSHDTTPKVATIGFFDGVHLGHRYLLSQLRLEAGRRSMHSLVVTFAEHPRLVFDPSVPLSLLSTTQEKIALLEQSSIDATLLLHFSRKFASQTSLQFMSVLSQQFGVRTLITGYDHHFGSDRTARFEDYCRYGRQIGMEVIAAQELAAQERSISSTAVRSALSSGDIAAANSLLASHYSLTGTVVPGHQIGRTIGFPTANILPDPHKLIPASGVYAVRAIVDDTELPAMLNIGTRPTLHGSHQTIEAHIINFSANIYGKTLTVIFDSRLRSEQKFPSLDALRSQIAIDRQIITDFYKK